MTLEPGACLVLYTDGIVERPGEALDEGLRRLRETVGMLNGGSASLCEGIVEAMLPEGTSRDDAALLVMRTTPLSNPLELSFPADIDTIPVLRRVLGRWLDERGGIREWRSTSSRWPARRRAQTRSSTRTHRGRRRSR